MMGFSYLSIMVESVGTPASIICITTLDFYENCYIKYNKWDMHKRVNGFIDRKNYYMIAK